MKTANIKKNIEFGNEKPKIDVLLETDFTKEIRIAFRKKQIMKEHQTPFPIVVQVFKGKIEFGVNEETHILKKGSIITLSGNVPHNLKALKKSIVRLTISKADKVERVQKVND